jgi:hypothetical protein
VKLTAKKVVVPTTPWDQNDGKTRYIRGTTIAFTFDNQTNHPLSVKLISGKRSASAGKPIPAGGARHWRLAFYYRGTFLLRSFSGTKVVATRTIVVS